MSLFGRNPNGLFALLIAGCLEICAPKAQAALLPPFFLDSVVALGGDVCSRDAKMVEHCVWATEGTGFQYGYLVKEDADPTKRLYVVFLVTAKHVVTEHQGEFHVRLNPVQSGLLGQQFPIPAQSDQGPWFFHPDSTVDIAITPVGVDLTALHIQNTFIASDTQSLSPDQMKDGGISAGDGSFVLGFPMNLAGVERNYVIVRQGTVARISELYDQVSPTFLLDSFVFPGNSGGPVFSKPEISSIAGTKNLASSALIGVVLAYQPYTDVAVSLQTKRARVTFEENSGLAVVLPVNFINQTIEAWLKFHPVSAPKAGALSDAKH